MEHKRYKHTSKHVRERKRYEKKTEERERERNRRETEICYLPFPLIPLRDGEEKFPTQTKGREGKLSRKS